MIAPSFAPRHPTSKGWFTGDEAAYLFQLAAQKRTAALRGWIRGAERRSDWGRMDGPALIRYARRLLWQVESKQAIQAMGATQ